MKGRDASRLAALLRSADDQKAGRCGYDGRGNPDHAARRDRERGNLAYAIEKRTGVTQSYLSKLMKGERG